MNKLFIVLPAYNEAANIHSVIEEWYPVVEKIGNGSKLVIINDGSKDETSDIVKRMKKKYKNLDIVDKVNSGHGSTCIYGYAYAVNHGADYVFQTDSDGQTNAGEFYQFWDLRNEYDFIIGSRKNRGDGFSRKVVTKVLKILLLLLFGTVVNDSNTPFRLMKSSRLKIYLEKIPPDFFLSNVLISVLICKRNEKVQWIDITFKPRQGGINSINLKKILMIGFKAINDFRLFIKNNKNFING